VEAFRRWFGSTEPVWEFRPGAIAAVLVGIFVLGLVAVAATFRPLGTPAIGFDAASSVLYFDRLASGQRLEAWVATTSKPLQTLLDGALYSVFGDWRSLSVVGTVEYAAMVALAAALAWRVAGPVAAGLAGVGLIGSAQLLEDGALAYATPWAVLLWAIAGLALARGASGSVGGGADRGTGTASGVGAGGRRWSVAGFALLLAALLRIETFLILGMAAVALAAWAALGGRRPGIERPPRAAALVLVGFGALPILCLHDWLLTGRPLYWLDVSSIVSTAISDSVKSAPELFKQLAGHYAGSPARLAALTLAVLGLVDLLRRRQWAVAAGLLAIGPGLVAFLELLALRHTYVSTRYQIPGDVAVVFGAAIGADAVARVALARATLARAGATARMQAGSLPRAAGAALAGAAIAVLIASPFGPINTDVRSSIDQSIALQSNARDALPEIRAAVDALSDRPARVLTDVEKPNSGPQPRLYVPALLVPQMAVELDLPVWAVHEDTPNAGNLPAARLTEPLVVYVDLDAGGGAQTTDPVRTLADGLPGNVRIATLWSDESRGLWVLEVSPGS